MYVNYNFSQQSQLDTMFQKMTLDKQVQQQNTQKKEDSESLDTEKQSRKVRMSPQPKKQSSNRQQKQQQQQLIFPESEYIQIPKQYPFHQAFQIKNNKIILQNGTYIICNTQNLVKQQPQNQQRISLFGNSIPASSVNPLKSKRPSQQMPKKQKPPSPQGDAAQYFNKKAAPIGSRAPPNLQSSKSPINLPVNQVRNVSNAAKIIRNEDFQSQLSEKDRTLMFQYFRHHLVNLLYAIGKKDDYFDAISSKKKLNVTVTNLKLTKQLLQMREEVLVKVKKQLSMKGRYKYREKFNFMNSCQLKSLNYDVKKRLAQVQQQRLVKCVSKEELDEEEVSPAIQKRKNMITVQVTDLGVWKKRNNLSSDDKVFIIKGGYNDLRQGLIDRGWIENQDVFSPCFDLKWSCKVADIDFPRLEEFQIVNHFDNNLAMASKFGLCRTLRSLIFQEDCDIDSWYPRCYDLGDFTDFEDFIEDFKITKAESILITYHQQLSDMNSMEEKVKLRLSLFVIQRKLRDILETINQLMFNNVYPVVISEEWEILKENDKNTQDLIKYEKMNQSLNEMGYPYFEHAQKFHEYYKPLIDEIVKKLQKIEPQFKLNGHRNIWILKPNFLSRGRGIKCFNQIEKILDHIIGKETQYVMQKYLENPMIIKQKKFDIRQWVLIEDFNPPRVWFYEQCYIRFCAEEYDIDNLNNRYAHLTNNSIAKHSENFHQSEIKGNMWSCHEFASYIQQITGKDIFWEQIQPKFKQIVILTAKAASDQMKARKNTYELFEKGYDFMIDEDFKPWLIEINSSPSMDQTTPVTQQMVPVLLEDTLKVMIDYSQAKKGTKKGIDTGLFTLIYKGGDLEKKGSLTVVNKANDF